MILMNLLMILMMILMIISPQLTRRVDENSNYSALIAIYNVAHAIQIVFKEYLNIQIV
jgi:hypothetical protein